MMSSAYPSILDLMSSSRIALSKHKLNNRGEFKDALFDIIKTYESRVNRLEPACVEEYTLRLKDGTKPIAQKRRSIPQGLFLEVKDQITELKEKGFIRDSKSALASPLVLVDKKDGGAHEMDEMFAALGGMKVFTTLDLKSGYYQVAVEESVRKVLAFNTPFGLFEWNRMPFGVKTAPDDVLVFGKTENEMLENLKMVLDRFGNYNLALNYKKCNFGVKQVKYLGFLVDEQGRRISPEKLDNLKKVKRPQT
ncbi:hypothetical protein ADUPG1_000041, partial [Aduncisulcus paluster]